MSEATRQEAAKALAAVEEVTAVGAADPHTLFSQAGRSGVANGMNSAATMACSSPPR